MPRHANSKACGFQRHFAGGGATEALGSPPFGGVWGKAFNIFEEYGA
ncbi:MAG: hypothetical protein ACI4M3_02895 [Acutalibacteraceae bacterium]